MRSLVEALASKGSITTTDAKARELRPYIERLITIGKRQSVAAERLLTSRLGTKQRAKILMLAAGTVGARQSGYTRIVKLPPRKGDGSKMAIIQIIKE